MIESVFCIRLIKKIKKNILSDLLLTLNVCICYLNCNPFFAWVCHYHYVISEKVLHKFIHLF